MVCSPECNAEDLLVENWGCWNEKLSHTRKKGRHDLAGQDIILSRTKYR